MQIRTFQMRAAQVRSFKKCCGHCRIFAMHRCGFTLFRRDGTPFRAGDASTHAGQWQSTQIKPLEISTAQVQSFPSVLLLIIQIYRPDNAVALTSDKQPFDVGSRQFRLNVLKRVAALLQIWLHSSASVIQKSLASVINLWFSSPSTPSLKPCWRLNACPALFRALTVISGGVRG